MELQRQVAHDEAQLARVDVVLLYQRPRFGLEAPAVGALVIGVLEQRQRGIAAAEGVLARIQGDVDELRLIVRLRGGAERGSPGQDQERRRSTRNETHLLHPETAQSWISRAVFKVPVSSLTFFIPRALRYSAIPSLTLRHTIGS